MSSQDGLCRGVPYVFEKGLETGELFGDKLETGFENWDDALDLINRMLDDDDFRNTQSQFALEHCRELTVGLVVSLHLMTSLMNPST